MPNLSKASTFVVSPCFACCVDEHHAAVDFESSRLRYEYLRFVSTILRFGDPLDRGESACLGFVVRQRARGSVEKKSEVEKE